MQKLYLVRILSTVVMVRVGGGWQPLHEFLQKYDPCRAKGRTNVDLGKVKPRKDAEGRVISPLKFLSKIKPGSEIGTPRATPPDGRARKPSGDITRGRVNMSAGVRSSASREFEGLDIEHDGKQISFPGYKVKGGYVSPYSCQALGLKKRSGSQSSLCSSGSTEFDSPVRKSPSKTLRQSSSRGSVLSKSSSRGSVTGKTQGTFGKAPRGLSTAASSTPRSNSKTDLSRMARSSPSPVTRPRHSTMSPRTPTPRTPTPRTPTPRTPTPSKSTTPISRTQSEARPRSSPRTASTAAASAPRTGSTAAASAPRTGSTSTPVRQRTGAISKSDSSGRVPISRRGTATSSTTPTTTKPKQMKPKKPAESKE